MKKMLIVDGNSILNRAFFGMPPLVSSTGIHTGAVYGMITILLPKIEELSPDYAAVAFDMRAPTFRHKMYEGYKAARHGMPDELAAQLPYAKKAMQSLGFKVLELEGYEADDLLGTMANIGEKSGAMVYILTGDRDSLQLIDDNVNVLLAGTGETKLFDKTAFAEKYGIDPSSFVDVKALMGDSSDNIPGVAGIGEKTALKLISKCGSLDSVYNSIDKGLPLPVGKSALEKLRAGKDDAYMSLNLSLIEKNAPINKDIRDLEYTGINKESTLSLFRELEFDKLIKRLSLLETQNKTKYDFEYKECKASESFSLGDGDLTSASIAAESDGTGLAFLRRGETRLKIRYSSLSEIKKIFDDNTVLCVYDSKDTIKLLRKNGITPKCGIFDVSLAAYVINPGEVTQELPKIASVYAGYDIPQEYNDGNAEDFGKFEAEALYMLHRPLSDKLEEEKAEHIYYDIELPLAQVLADMELLGFKVDCSGLAEFGAKLSEEADISAKKIYALADTEFNINSPKQLGEILFEKLGLPPIKKTKNGYSTSADILEKLRPYHPIISAVFDYRQLSKLKSTYADGLLRAADENGIIHTSFKQNVTATGRLSSVDPNLQNIPIRTELGRQFRRYFIPRSDDRLLIDADYSQIELRVLAHMADDKAMQEAFKSGEDIHTITASQVFRVPRESVTPELRKRAKAVNFGIVYGIGDFSLAQDIGVTKRQAKEYIESYLDHYSGIRRFMNEIVEQAKELGYVTTLYGRRRYIPELHSPKAPLRAFGERAAMNSPIQGTAADIIKIAMIETSRALKEAGIDARLILQVHDELIVEAHESCADKAAEILRDKMENAVELSVPLTVELGIGKTWFEQK